MTNFCIYDCAYCVNRVSSRVERARFTVEEVVTLTVEFYRRNYIEGLFLSSGIIRSPDDTMADMVRIARTLREQENFRGYIHLKTIPDAAPDLIDERPRRTRAAFARRWPRCGCAAKPRARLRIPAGGRPASRPPGNRRR